MNTSHSQSFEKASLNLDAIPRTIALLCNSGTVPELPLGSPYLHMVDQTLLPQKLVYLDLFDWRDVIDAIQRLALRGAPALGVGGAGTLALWAAQYQNHYLDKDTLTGFTRDFSLDSYREALSIAAETIAAARPTAVNLSWGVRQAYERAEAVMEAAAVKQTPALCGAVTEALIELTQQMEAADEAANRSIGDFGAQLLPEHCRVLTHCNAGSLATVFYGTALGVVYSAATAGKIDHVYADETRPLGQGARLTTFELARASIPVTLICDDMAASVMSRGLVDAVIVGADRIAANGDVANKIGTLNVAILASYFSVPFYVAAPLSTIDWDTPTGDAIPIEQRPTEEVMVDPPTGVQIENPAFDVTPAHLVTAIITDCGVLKPTALKASYQALVG